VSTSGHNREFLWGAATASYQIEGSPLADGAGPSIWHEFAHRRGKIRNGDTGDVACDHYRRYREDAAEMGRLGLEAYRFSVSWGRIVPEADRINPPGLDFYDRLVDSLLEQRIVPFCTLFHWDTPLWLERRGGFVSRDSVESLFHYGGLLFERLGDRVKHWITINEPVVYASHGYLYGRHAPGQRWRLRRMFAAAHHLLLGHTRLVRLLRETVKDGSIGIAQHQIWGAPLDPDDPRDIRAAELADQIINRFYMDPLFLGEYPPEAVKRLRRFLPKGYERDLETMRVPGDFVGLNFYQVQSYRYSPWMPWVRAREAPTPGAVKNDLGWEIDPEGLYRLLRRIDADYGSPVVYVTENGYPTIEEPGQNGSGRSRGSSTARAVETAQGSSTVKAGSTAPADSTATAGSGEPPGVLEDPARIAYLDSHVRAVARARRDGVQVKGYFVWSLMDNFEWAEGYRARFGLLRVDFPTQTRAWRSSARWYRDRIRAGAPEAE
jgi:beta-glucosidase